MRVATLARGMATAGAVFVIAAGSAIAPEMAQPVSAGKIDPADTAWMIAAAALVLMMSIPGLALFYAGMVRKKNVLATMAQTLAVTALCSVLWAAIGYTLTFGGDGPWLGTLSEIGLRGITMDAIIPFAKTIPEAL